MECLITACHLDLVLTLKLHFHSKKHQQHANEAKNTGKNDRIYRVPVLQTGVCLHLSGGRLKQKRAIPAPEQLKSLNSRFAQRFDTLFFQLIFKVHTEFGFFCF